jgi:integrase
MQLRQPCYNRSVSLLVPLRDVQLAERESLRQRYLEQARAPGTKLVYERHWIRFVGWCELVGVSVPIDDRLVQPVEPAIVADYIVSLAERGLAASTIEVAVAAIGARHLSSALPTPTAHPGVREVMSGASRQSAREGRGRGSADPILPEELRRMLACLHPGLLGCRNASILTFGLAGGFRREELARLQVTDLKLQPDGILVSLRWSKTDQDGEGHERRISAGDFPELCPVQWIRTWLSSAGIDSGPLFRAIDRMGGLTERGLDPRRIDQIVREQASRARERFPDSFRGGHYSAHSLRSGLATAALLAGKDVREVQEHLGHRSVQTTLRYQRAAHVRGSSVTKGIGL